MEKRKLKKPVFYGLCVTTLAILLGALYYVDNSNNSLSQPQDQDYKYVSRLFEDETQAVVNTQTLVMRPYNNADVKALQNFYDYQGKETDQEKSIINYETTYIQNNGVAYGGLSDTFDAVSILDGTVTSIKDDKLLGKVVTIDHGNNIISSYQSLSEVLVKENDKVTQGMAIGKAGQSNINKNLGNHILFELNIDGQYVNPENCYDKAVDQLKSN